MPAELYLDLLAFEPGGQPRTALEPRLTAFLESDDFTESLDGPAFAQLNGAGAKADYLLGARNLIAELKTINADPTCQMESRLKERLSQPGAPYVIGSIGISAVTRELSDGDEVNKMLVDMAGRAIRRHLRKANDQIGAIKDRLSLPKAGGLVILMNDSEPLIDAGAIAYSIKAAFDTVSGGFPHITYVWASIECHRVHMPGERVGFPQVMVIRTYDRERELDYMARMLSAWAVHNGGKIESIPHHGRWDAFASVYDGSAPVLSPYR